MKLPKWAMNIVIKFIKKNIPGIVNDWQNKHAPALGKAAKDVVANDTTLKEAIMTYVKYTENAEDDVIAEKVEMYYSAIIGVIKDILKSIDEKPFMQVITELPPIVIPDFNDDPTDDITISAAILEILMAMASDEHFEE